MTQGARGGASAQREIALLYVGNAGAGSLPASVVRFLRARSEADEHLVLWGVDQEVIESLSCLVRDWDRFFPLPHDGDEDGLLQALPVSAAATVVLFGPSRAREALSLLRRSDPETSVHVVPADLDLKREAVGHDLGALYGLTDRLRRECPWDRKQTQEDIVAYTLEETYELIDAVRTPGLRSHELVRGELGDLLFQVYFLARVAEGEGWYDLGQVADGIRRKLVRRHPHIFGETVADTPEEVKRNWDEIKRTTEGREGIFHEVAAAFPAVLFAQKLQQRAATVGFDWERPEDVLSKIREETGELEEAMRGASSERVAEEAGDLLFAMVNLARKLKVDPELSLRASSHRFQERVEHAAGLAESEGREFEGVPLAEKEEYYLRAKAGLRARDQGTSDLGGQQA